MADHDAIDVGLLSRAQGCLLGQPAGDSLASLVEFQEAVTRPIYSLVGDVFGGLVAERLLVGAGRRG